jgi:hypothetical protein
VSRRRREPSAATTTTITIDHSDNKQDAAATWKKTFGHHPLLVFLDRPEIAGGEALAGLLRPGNAGSNTAADHVTVLGWALESLPGAYRPDPDDPGAPHILVRSDSAGATHTFADACRAAGVGFSFGYAVDTRVRGAVEILNSNNGWYPAIDSGGGLRDGAWVAEATGLVEMSSWPTGTRVILRKERPHPGAQLRFTDSDGLRVTAFITDTGHGVVAGQLGGLELRHRQHARVEDRIRQAKATGLRNLPCHRSDANAAWLEIILAATDLVAWSKLIGFTDHPDLVTCEIGTFRYRVLHVAAHITRGARQIRLRIDATWRWDRGGKVFVDSTRAGGATVAAAYSPRLRPGTPVSFPLDWSDLDRVTPGDFTVHTAIDALTGGDPWAASMPAPQRLPDDLIEHGRTIPVARVAAMHEGKRRARARRTDDS